MQACVPGRRRWRGASLILAPHLLSACSRSGAGEPYPVFDAPELQLGREVWLANCAVCHGSGLAAPRMGDRAAWSGRIDQGMDALFSHALNGLAGTSGGEMPARGGNPQLGDAAVIAVRYMVRASE